MTKIRRISKAVTNSKSKILACESGKSFDDKQSSEYFSDCVVQQTSGALKPSHTISKLIKYIMQTDVPSIILSAIMTLDLQAFVQYKSMTNSEK